VKKTKDRMPKAKREAPLESQAGTPFVPPPDTDPSDSSSNRPETVEFPVVALGASAGGLEALRQLFAHLPAESGVGFVVIQHLDPDRPSMLTKVLEGVTRLRVVEVTSGMRVEPDRVHVIPARYPCTLAPAKDRPAAPADRYLLPLAR
jgi:two-component system CheB/CheR fusion protein